MAAMANPANPRRRVSNESPELSCHPTCWVAIPTSRSPFGLESLGAGVDLTINADSPSLQETSR
jgi:hypothetical protein